MKISSYSSDEVIITEGEVGDKFYIVYTGEVSISKGQKMHVLKGKITQVSTSTSTKTRFRNTYATFSLVTLSES